MDTTKPVNEPTYVAVDLYKREARTVNGKRHSTLRNSEIRVVDTRGETVCIMARSDQDALDTAWRIAKFLDTYGLLTEPEQEQLRITETGRTLSPLLGQ